ncbi:MAG TPA: hypothetical protein VGA87_01500 [Pyrinomonadaceae bacterium]|jgi:uncharacterized membrane protein YfcA
MVVATKKRGNLRWQPWWALLAAYLIMFLVTGYIAFIAKDPDIPLMRQVNTMTAGVTDAQMKAAMISIYQQEENEHETKAEMAAQGFHIVLGSLIGFLSASAVADRRSGGGQ